MEGGKIGIGGRSEGRRKVEGRKKHEWRGKETFIGGGGDRGGECRGGKGGMK